MTPREVRRRIPSIGPSITDAEVALVAEAARDGWYEGMSRYIDQFVLEFEDHCGMKYCLPTSHGTAAIHLALLGLRVGPGDDVVVPDITWVASAAPVLYVGAAPVFADIDADTWCLSAESFERSVTPRTRAVIAVDLFGGFPEMTEIKRIARRHKIHVIEDAAEAMGATYRGRPAGSLGKVGVYSFNATKLVIAGQGGMAVTNDRRLFERMKLLSHHGILKAPGARYYWSHELGFNYNWTNIQAALALAQLRRLSELVTHRRQVHAWYRERLVEIDGLRLNVEPEGVTNTFWITCGFLDPAHGLTKEDVQARMAEHDIDVRPFFYPISSMPPYARLAGARGKKRANKVSYGMSPYGVCFPSGADLTEGEVDRVCEVFRSVLRIQRR